jgi:hypothetical protein
VNASEHTAAILVIVVPFGECRGDR